MKRTAKHIEDIMQIMNASPTIQAEMDKLAVKSVEMNLTDKQWEDFKLAMLTTMFYKMAQLIPEIKEDLGKDIYEALTA